MKTINYSKIAGEYADTWLRNSKQNVGKNKLMDFCELILKVNVMIEEANESKKFSIAQGR